MPRKVVTNPQELATQQARIHEAAENRPSELPRVAGLTNLPPFFHTNRGVLYHINAMDLLKRLPDRSIDCVFTDPPYNIGKAGWDKFPSMGDYMTWVDEWLGECYRVLSDNGSMYVMGFSEILAHVSVMSEIYFESVRWLIWHYRNKPSLGKSDWVRSHEAILHLRKSKDSPFYMDMIRVPYNQHTKKYPDHPHGKTSQYWNGKDRAWSVNPYGAKPRDVIDIPALCNGMKEKTSHPTQKPEELLRRLLLAVTQPGQVVLDPFGGSGTTYVVAEQLNLAWLGTELDFDYCKIIASRLAQLPEKPIEYWLEEDWKRQQNRHAARSGG